MNEEEQEEGGSKQANKQARHRPPLLWRRHVVLNSKHTNPTKTPPGAVLLKEIDHPLVYLSLLPIIGGVALASLKELDFKMKALICALAANQVRSEAYMS